jgi:protein kinase N
VLKLDNVEVARTSWKVCSQQAWDQRFSITLDKSRELEVSIYWKDWRSLCAVKFLKLEEFIDDSRHGMAVQMEPQGLLFAEVRVLPLSAGCSASHSDSSHALCNLPLNNSCQYFSLKPFFT